MKRLGGDGVVTPTERNAEQTQIAIYWGYDGTPGLGTPPRLYNLTAATRSSRCTGTGARSECRVAGLRR
ncbi:MAG: hypothetical protein ACRDGN_14000 [bacterium]